MFWSTLFHIMFKELMLSNCGAGEDSWKSLGKHGDQTSQSERKWTLNTLRKDWCWDWCWNWSSSTLATWCKQLTHWKRPWCWERLKAEEEGERGWDGWMALLIQWTWAWANSGRCWGTWEPGVQKSMGSQRVGHNLVTEQQQMFNTYLDHLYLLFINFLHKKKYIYIMQVYCTWLFFYSIYSLRLK